MIKGMMILYKKDDYVRIIHPDYPEESQVARVVSNPYIPTLLTLELCTDKSRCLAHTDYIRYATQDEIDNLI